MANTILTRELLEQITGAVADGGYFETSCRAFGVSPEDGRNWRKWGAEGKDAQGLDTSIFRDFFTAYEKADANAELDCTREVKRAGKPHSKPTDPDTGEELVEGQWQAMMTFMERRWHERFGRKDKLGLGQDPNAGPVQTQQIPMPVFAEDDAMNHFEEGADVCPPSDDDEEPAT